MHVLPRVRELERRFPDVLAVIGVHAGKYTAERQTARIASACERLRVAHPVVNDRQFRIWRSYAVEAWPTVALITPDGHLLTTRPGEFPVEELVGILDKAVAAYDAEGLVDHSTPVPTSGHPADDGGRLRFPSRLHFHGGRLYVSDTGHDRVLELRLLGRRKDSAPLGVVERVWGCGEPGMIDGTLEHSAFCMPTGLAAQGDTLFVADRGNHALRAISLSGGTVTTVAGTGSMGPMSVRSGSGASSTLRSPWGLSLWGESLVIAMAGSHQLWQMPLGSRSLLSPLAGTSGEALADGPGAAAMLAQPMGVASANGSLYFADAESSSVRRRPGGPQHEVTTLVGTGLFDFGDKDGVGDDARLQHPEDLTMHEGHIVVADTYNDKLRSVDPVTRECRALPGEAGSGDMLSAPAGVASSGDVLFVADTDAHRIVTVDVPSGAVVEIEID
jgi:hypothetical protein